MSCRRPANRTPEHVETWVVMLAHMHPDRGCRVVVCLLERGYGVSLCHQTVRNILKRCCRFSLAALLLAASHLWRRLLRRPAKLLPRTPALEAQSAPTSPPVANRPAVRGWHPMTPEVALQVVRLHVEQLGAPLSDLRDQVNALFGSAYTTKTVARTISGNKALVDRLLGRVPQSIATRRPGELWGIDLTEVRVLLVFRVQILGVVDYFGSRLIALQPVRSAKSVDVIKVLEESFERCGKPERVISDRGPNFTSKEFKTFLSSHGIAHTMIRPAHAWTNGRIERVFLTLKVTISFYFMLIVSQSQLAMICREFVLYYNAARPHSSWGGRTPDEVYFGRPKAMKAEPASFFDGRMRWYRFGY